MAKTTRDYLKRKVAQCYHHLDECTLRLAELETTFREPHPELADALIIAAQSIQVTEQLINAFSIKCWNATKESIEHFRT